jgi:putative MATE family efflux protein
MLKRYIGDKKFYRELMIVAVPIMVQNFITNFVSMIDNIMVGQVGTAQMSGVSIVNQVLFVLNLCIFGAVSGAGIFTAQFAGQKDYEGVRHTVRFKLIACLTLSVVGIIIFSFGGRELIMLYLKGEGSQQEASDYLFYGLKYLKIMLWGIVPFALSNMYCSTLRENRQTLVPMYAGISAVAVNLVLNYLLIFGKFGMPEMGVEGAALATVISRFVELFIAALWTHKNTDKMPFAKGLYSSLKIPADLAKHIMIKGMPLVLNEGLWSAGMAFLNQCYSIRGLSVVAAVNICSTITNAMNSSIISLGNAVGIITGQKLGAGESEKEIVSSTRKLCAFSIAFSVIFMVLEAIVAEFFPLIYNTTDEVRSYATSFILTAALFLPAVAFANATYFTLRSGGKTLVTFLFDSCFVCVVSVPLAYCLSRFTSIPIVPLYFCCQATEVVKCFLGAYMLKRKTWIQNITVK